MVNLEQIKQDVSNLPEEAQILVTDFIESLKKRYSVAEKQEITSDLNLNNKAEDWADFIGCMEAESDLSENYKTYLKQKLDEKYNNY
jgi:hypothetical protein